MATASDNFNRADGAVGTNWTTWWDTAFNISTNRAVPPAGATGSSCWNSSVTAFTGNHKSTATIANLGGGSAWDSGPAVRCVNTGGGAGYVLSNFDNTNIDLYRVSGGSGAQVATHAGVYATSDIIELEANGAVLTIRKNGTTLFTYTDPSPLSGGQPGLYGYNNDVAWDDWTGADVSSSSDTPLTVTQASLTVTGQDITLTVGGSTALTVTEGTLTLAGQDVALVAGASSTLPVTSASIAAQGQDVTFVVDTPWTEASLGLTGSDITLTATGSITLAVTEAALSLTGSDVTLTADFDYTITVDSGTLSLAGQDVTFQVASGSVVLDVTNATLVLTGSDIGVNPSITISSSGSPRRKRYRGIRRLINIGR